MSTDKNWQAEFEQKWKQALQKAGMLQTESEENIYIPENEKRIVYLRLSETSIVYAPPRGNRVTRSKQYVLKATIKKQEDPYKNRKPIEIDSITTQSFTSRKELRNFRLFLIKEQPILGITFKPEVSK
jgi:hypothetical protein